MHLIPPTGRKRKFTIRFKNVTGRWEKLYAWDTRDRSQRLGVLVKDLVAARLDAAPVPAHLQPKIDALPERVLKRLSELGLIDRRRRGVLYDADTVRSWNEIERDRKAAEEAKKAYDPPHVDRYMLAVAARKANTRDHAVRMARLVVKVLRALNIERPEEISASDVDVVLDEWKLHDNTRRLYLIAMKDFCRWLKREKRAASDPMEDVDLPPDDSEPTFERRALTLDEFRRLLVYLDGLQGEGGYYKGQHAGWSAEDRKFVYWLAATTGLRQNELRQLQRHQLHLASAGSGDASYVEVKAGTAQARRAATSSKGAVAKNRKKATVPFPAELADQLRTYVADLEPSDKVLRVPVSRNDVVAMFRRDLKEAGIELEDEDTGKRVDFHALRSTALTWWGTEYRKPDGTSLSVREVAELGRCSPRIAERYMKGFRRRSDAWLDSAPSLAPAKPAEQGQPAAQKAG